MTLSLSLVFNDLKDLTWPGMLLMHLSLDTPAGVTPVWGQLIGMQNFFTRHSSGVVSELGQLLESKKALLNTEAFKEARSKIANASAKRAWDELVAAFTQLPTPKGTKRKLASKEAEYFKYVRDKAAYHYGNEPNEDLLLAGGYETVFQSPAPEGTATGAAYASLGESLEGSRFYFADAAVQSLINKAMAQNNVTAAEIVGFLKSVNLALRFIIEALLDHLKTARVSKAGDP